MIPKKIAKKLEVLFKDFNKSIVASVGRGLVVSIVVIMRDIWEAQPIGE